MPTTQIGAVGVLASLVLVAVAIGLSWWRGLRLEASIAWSAGRAAVQLTIVGMALAIVLDPGAPVVLAWAWVLGMIVFAAATVRSRAPEVPGILPVAFAALGCVAVVSLAVVFGLGIFPAEARVIVPIGGMMIGNAMTATVVAARRVLSEIQDRRDEVEARLALGQSWQEAARPFVRSALRTALTPQIESTKAVGLVFLPGAMTGLILAGVSPADAVLVQLAIMYLILGSVATSVTVVGIGVSRRLFTADQRLAVPPPAKAGGGGR